MPELERLAYQYHPGHGVPDRELPAPPGERFSEYFDANTHLLIHADTLITLIRPQSRWQAWRRTWPRVQADFLCWSASRRTGGFLRRAAGKSRALLQNRRNVSGAEIDARTGTMRFA